MLYCQYILKNFSSVVYFNRKISNKQNGNPIEGRENELSVVIRDGKITHESLNFRKS